MKFKRDFCNPRNNLNGMNGTTKDFQITDLLGNVRTVLTFKMTDSTTSMSSYDYKQFGDTLNTTSGKELRLGFIGRERDYENNYFAFGARNYDSETGRFLSVDQLFNNLIIGILFQQQDL